MWLYLGCRAGHTEAAGSPGQDAEAPERGTCLRCPGKQGVGRVGCACRGAGHWPFLGARWEPASVPAERGMSQPPFSRDPVGGGAQGREKPGPASASSLAAAPGRQEVGSGRVCARAGLCADGCLPKQPSPLRPLPSPPPWQLLFVGTGRRTTGAARREAGGGPRRRGCCGAVPALRTVISVCSVSHR